MPELPEVETVRKQIKKILPFKVASLQQSQFLKSILHTPLTGLKGRTFIDIHRKGKLLYFELDDGRYLLSHLGMSGAWLIAQNKVIEKHTHLQFSTGEIFLAYVDPRRFGHMYLLNKRDTQQKLGELGVDIASSQFNRDYLLYTLNKFPNRPIKAHLLDQKYFAGSGNYIANEICARAGIHPLRKNCEITSKESRQIIKATQIVLAGALKTNGTTFQGGYRDTRGQKGSGVDHLVVFYQEICQLCGISKVQKIYLNKRGTYFCPRCQS